MTNTRSPRSQLAHQVRQAIEPLREVLAGLVPLDVPLPYAVEVLEAFIEFEKLAASGRVLIAKRAAESKEWERAGCPSPEAWLALKQGTDPGRAKADLDTSGLLDDLPNTADEMRAGNLSPQQAGAVAEGASVNPDAEQDLLDTAKSDSLKHTREEAARRKAEVEAEQDKVERERRVHQRRRASWGTKEGKWWLYAEGPLPTGAEAQQALENRLGELHRERRHGTREGRSQYAYDALMDLITRASDDTTGDGSPQPTTRRTSIKKLMLVRVDLTALINGHMSKGEVCEIPGIGSVSVEQARQMFGDSILRLVTTNGTAVIDVINPSRVPTEGQKIAKLWTDPKCCVAGCNSTLRLEFEHREDYARTGHTVLLETEHMCRYHHDLKTLDDWQLVEGTGRRAFVPPTDPRHPKHSGKDPP